MWKQNTTKRRDFLLNRKWFVEEPMSFKIGGFSHRHVMFAAILCVLDCVVAADSRFRTVTCSRGLR